MRVPYDMFALIHCRTISVVLLPTCTAHTLSSHITPPSRCSQSLASPSFFALLQAVQDCLGQNRALQRLDLSRNGFSDLDAARIVKGLTGHGELRGRAGGEEHDWMFSDLDVWSCWDSGIARYCLTDRNEQRSTRHKFDGWIFPQHSYTLMFACARQATGAMWTCRSTTWVRALPWCLESWLTSWQMYVPTLYLI